MPKILVKTFFCVGIVSDTRKLLIVRDFINLFFNYDYDVIVPVLLIFKIISTTLKNLKNKLHNIFVNFEYMNEKLQRPH